MKVAYLTHIISYGGATISLELLNKGLSQYPVERKIYVVDITDNIFVSRLQQTDAKFEQVVIKPIYNFQYGHVPFINFLYYITINYRSFVEKLVQENVDILHVNTTAYPHLIHYVKRYSNIKVVTHIREMLPSFWPGIIQKYLVRNIYKYSDAIIAISDNEAQYFRGHPGLRIIPNPVELHEQTEVKEDGHGILRIGMVANMSAGKGHMLFLAAVRLLKERFPAAKFFVVGSKPYFQQAVQEANVSLLQNDFERQCYAYIKENNLSDYVQFIPYTGDVAGIIRNWTVFVRPSLSKDPWGRDIIEAMSLGLPIVATGSSEFYVQHGKNGFLVKETEPDLLANAIARLLNDQDLQATFSKNNIEKIRNMCSLENHAKRIFEVYNEILRK